MRIRRFRPWLLVLLALTLVGGEAKAQTPANELKVFLLTMGSGDEVWEKFGHNAIWIHDPAHGTDRVYNYGVFDFHSPGYWERFVRGTWIYQIAAADIDRTLFEYRYLNRTLTAQELELTPTEAAELQGFLEWNLRPENREYLYDYYRDNCSTRVRDALDRVLGGALHAATADVPTATTYRAHSLRLTREDPTTYTGLQLGLGPAADVPISRWEEMFLPEKVQERVRELRVPGPDGQMVPLVRAEHVLYQAVGRPAEAEAAPSRIGRYLFLGAALAGVLLLLARAAARNVAARIGFATLASLWTALIGAGGVLLLGLWAFTNHAIAYRNENVLQFNALALPLALLVPALVFGARWARRPARWLACAVAALSALGLLVQLLPWFNQVNGEIIALALPVNLVLGWAVHRLGGGRSGAGEGETKGAVRQAVSSR